MFPIVYSTVFMTRRQEPSMSASSWQFSSDIRPRDLDPATLSESSSAPLLKNSMLCLMTTTERESVATEMAFGFTTHDELDYNENFLSNLETLLEAGLLVLPLPFPKPDKVSETKVPCIWFTKLFGDETSVDRDPEVSVRDDVALGSKLMLASERDTPLTRFLTKVFETKDPRVAFAYCE